MRRLSASIVGCGMESVFTHSRPAGMCETQWVAGRMYGQASTDPIITSMTPAPPVLAEVAICGTPVSGFWIWPYTWSI